MNAGETMQRSTPYRLLLVSANRPHAFITTIPSSCLADDGCAWLEFDERTAASHRYTSGTTGNPTGALHTFAPPPDVMRASARNTAWPVVAAGSRVAITAPMNGVDLVRA